MGAYVEGEPNTQSSADQTDTVEKKPKGLDTLAKSKTEPKSDPTPQPTPGSIGNPQPLSLEEAFERYRRQLNTILEEPDYDKAKLRSYNCYNTCFGPQSVTDWPPDWDQKGMRLRDEILQRLEEKHVKKTDKALFA